MPRSRRNPIDLGQAFFVLFDVLQHAVIVRQMGSGSPSVKRRIAVITAGIILACVPITGTVPFTKTFNLTTSAGLRDRRVIEFEPFGRGVEAITPFTVIDEENPTADVFINKSPINNPVDAGAQTLFGIQVTNNGPGSALNVQITDAVPANTIFKSFTRLNGPVFSCTSPILDSDSGSTVCTIASLNKGETATFIAAYEIKSGTADGTEISNTSTVSSTNDDDPDNNSATAISTVKTTPCVLSCPGNITVQADSGQAGTFVNYTAPTTSGNCGEVSCNFASGSFFPAGTTNVICAGETGDACAFQVTVENPGGLSISLSGPSTVTIECGQRFADPAATAVDSSGLSVPVVINYPSGFNPDAPAVGTYTITYTATQDPNSISTTRTVNVADTEKPLITIDGTNPYKIIQGSCLPFVDPGASALDGCAGPKPVTISISGPRGLTAVDNKTPGTYTVTYTATDGTRQATATRTVLVGMFSEDEADQPASSDVPPTITLNGDDSIEIERGAAFNDPGATANVCGTPVPVTVKGSVDIHTPGIYTLTYTATANGLTSTATRLVIVNPDHITQVIRNTCDDRQITMIAEDHRGWFLATMATVSRVRFGLLTADGQTLRTLDFASVLDSSNALDHNGSR